jgi:PAS domain S-box-containing protein/putative nucleotidyltransferase with HDIG domain
LGRTTPELRKVAEETMAGKTRTKETETGAGKASVPTGDIRDERFRILSENSPVGVCIIENQLFTYVNRAFADMFGYSADELIGIKGPKDTVFPHDRPSLGKLAELGASDGRSAVRLHFRGVKKDGGLIDVELHVSKTTHEKQTFLIGTVLDITDRKKAEEALQAAHRNLQDIVDFLPDATFVIDNDRRVIVWNRAAEEMTGVRKEEIIGKGDAAYGVAFYGQKWPMLIDLLDTPDAADAAYDFVSHKGKTLSAELFIPSLYGGMGAHAWATASPLFDSDGNVVGAIESISDISIQKDAERQLHESEERYRIAIENSNDGVALVRDGQYIYVNSRFLDIFGYAGPEEVLGKKQLVVVHEDDRERVAEIARQRARDEEVPARYEFKGVREDGTLLHIEVSASFVNYLGENVLLAYLKDITEQRKAEEKLLQLAAIADASDDAIFGISSSGTIISWNSGAEKIYGYSAAQMSGAPVSIILHPSKYVEVMEMVTKLKHGEHIDHFETVHIRKDGKLIDVSLTMSPLKGSDGSIIGGATIARDITQRKRVEAELQASMERLRTTMDGIIHAMSVTLEMRDPYTAGHQKRVATLAGMIAEEMGLPEEKREAIYMAALMHDLGKIRVPAEILSKPGQLSDIEFDLIKTHPQVGYEILKNIRFSAPIAKIILQHHESMDGSGYPNGLAGDEILLEARILTVADVVEAISSHRPYRPAFSIDRALDRIAEGKGVLWDAEVVDACLRVFREKGFVFALENASL